MSVCECVREMEMLIQNDPTDRGIQHLHLPGELWKAARTLSNADTVVLTTGFPCMLDAIVPTETDGPPGVAAVAYTLARLGKNVLVVVDSWHLQVMRHCLEQLACDFLQRVSIELYPANAKDEKAFVSRLLDRKEASAMVAIERVGPAMDGKCYSMRGKDLSGYYDNIHNLFCEANNRANFVTICVGDGGNELGMGKVQHLVEIHIRNGERIACAVAADIAITAGVSNWGGYALSAAVVAIKACESPQELRREVLQRCLYTVDQDTRVMQAVLRAGGSDGVLQKAIMSVDSLPHRVHLDVIHRLSSFVSRCCGLGSKL